MKQESGIVNIIENILDHVGNTTMCTFYGGWAASGIVRPTTVSDMLALYGSIEKNI